MRINWSAPVSDEEAARRAAGRRAYNSWRKLVAAHRRTKVADLLTRYGLGRGVQTRIAGELGVSPATVSKDVKKLREMYRPCPVCGSFVHVEQIDWSALRPVQTGRQDSGQTRPADLGCPTF